MGVRVWLLMGVSVNGWFWWCRFRGDDVECEEYHLRIARDPEMSDYIDKIRAIVDSNCQDCKTLMVQFNDFFFLWTDDIPSVFQQFLNGKLQPYPLREEVKGHVSDQATAAKSSRSLTSLHYTTFFSSLRKITAEIYYSIQNFLIFSRRFSREKSRL